MCRVYEVALPDERDRSIAFEMLPFTHDGHAWNRDSTELVGRKDALCVRVVNGEEFRRNLAALLEQRHPLHHGLTHGRSDREGVNPVAPGIRLRRDDVGVLRPLRVVRGLHLSAPLLHELVDGGREDLVVKTLHALAANLEVEAGEAAPFRGGGVWPGFPRPRCDLLSHLLPDALLDLR